MSFKHSKDINGLCEAPRCGAAALIMVLYLPHFVRPFVVLEWNVSFHLPHLHSPAFLSSPIQQRKPTYLSLETSIIYKLGVTILIKTDYALKYENYLIL